MSSEYRPAKLRQRKNARLPEEKWQPTQWKPEYETILALHAHGKTNVEIAGITGYTPMQISNILTCEQAKAIKEHYVNSIRDSVTDDLKSLEKKALKRMNQVLDNDDLMESSPLSIFDRSLAVLKGTAKLVPEGSTINQNNTQNNVNVFSDEMGAKLLEGLTRSDEARKLNAGVTGDSIN